jgi:hypothetical protein
MDFWPKFIYSVSKGSTNQTTSLVFENEIEMDISGNWKNSHNSILANREIVSIIGKLSSKA